MLGEVEHGEHLAMWRSRVPPETSKRWQPLTGACRQRIDRGMRSWARWQHGQPAWHSCFSPHCKKGAAPTCRDTGIKSSAVVDEEEPPDLHLDVPSLQPAGTLVRASLPATHIQQTFPGSKTYCTCPVIPFHGMSILATASCLLLLFCFHVHWPSVDGGKQPTPKQKKPVFFGDFRA